MANPTDISKEDALNKEKHESENPDEDGRKAIEARKKFNYQGKTPEEIKEEERKDAEQWRNEG